MIQLRKSNERGHAHHGWLEAYHSFSFAEYYDPRFVGFRDLVVINEDRVQPGTGFGRHGHRDMEIVTYVLAGALEHKDSMGSGAVLRYGDVQRMSAGSGVKHSEFNHSQTELLHLLQIWIQPAAAGIPPSYEDKNIPMALKKNRLGLFVSSDGREGSMRMHQNASIYASVLDPGVKVQHRLMPKRHAWLQVARGELTLNGFVMHSGDGAAISEESNLEIVAGPQSIANLAGTEPGAVEFLLFDLP